MLIKIEENAILKILQYLENLSHLKKQLDRGWRGWKKKKEKRKKLGRCQILHDSAWNGNGGACGRSG